MLGRSWRLWQQTDLPYESARARLHYAEALAAEGDETTARRDLLAARSVFERLGAKLDLERVDALLGEGGGATSPARAPRRVTQTFMFTDIVTSTDLVGLIGDEAWSELLRWHDRELRSAFAEPRGEEVDAHRRRLLRRLRAAADAIECAVDIQRRLARHRREHGFAPCGPDRPPRGRGDARAAATTAAAACTSPPAWARPRAREEILVSTARPDRRAGAIRFGLSDPRLLTLKGVGEPVEVRASSGDRPPVEPATTEHRLV